MLSAREMDAREGLREKLTKKLAQKKRLEMGECHELNPGFCQCDLKRCSGCGYTAHDKGYWMDHHLCKARS